MTTESARTAGRSVPCSGDSPIARPESGHHEEMLVRDFARVLSKEELRAFRERRLNMCSDKGVRYHCIAVGSLYLTAVALFELCEKHGIDPHKELGL